MDLQELGALLRQTRESRGLSLGEISSKIKLPTRIVSALEAGQITELPHPVYARGFIKSYAELLGLDREEIAKHLQEAFPAFYVAETPEAGPMSRVSIEPNQGGRHLLALFVFFLGMSLLIGGWLFYNKYGDISLERVKGFYVSLTNKAGAVVTQGHEEPTARTTAAPAQNSSTTGTQVQQGQNAQQPQQAQQGALVENPAVQESVAVVEAEQPQSLPVTQSVEVIAKRGTRIEYAVDGGETRSLYLTRTQSTKLEFQKQLHLKLMNPSSVSIRYNEEDFQIEASQGNSSKTLNFPPPSGI